MTNGQLGAGFLLFNQRCGADRNQIGAPLGAPVERSQQRMRATWQAMIFVSRA
jgi:hypothetical protein